MDGLYQSLLGLLGGGLSGWIVTQHQKRLDKRDEDERKTRESELAAAREKQWTDMQNTVQELKKIIMRHINDDQSPVIFNELKNIGGNIEKLLSQQQALLVSDEQQRQQIITLFNNASELKDELRECKREHRYNGKISDPACDYQRPV